MPDLEIPIALSTEILLPFPSEQNKSGYMKKECNVEFTNVKLKAVNQKLRITSRVNFKRK